MWRPAYVALGSNLGGPRAQVLEAFGRLALLESTRVELRSRLYVSKPLGPTDQPDYVNAVAGLLTQLPAHALLAALQEVERAMGRERREHWGPRTIDLDLLWMPGPPIEDASLTLPHPGVHLRNFVLYPLCDVAPALRIAALGTASSLLARVAADGISVLPE